jgi:hypothetical protein
MAPTRCYGRWRHHPVRYSSTAMGEPRIRSDVETCDEMRLRKKHRILLWMRADQPRRMTLHQFAMFPERRDEDRISLLAFSAQRCVLQSRRGRKTTTRRTRCVRLVSPSQRRHCSRQARWFRTRPRQRHLEHRQECALPPRTFNRSNRSRTGITVDIIAGGLIRGSAPTRITRTIVRITRTTAGTTTAITDAVMATRRPAGGAPEQG